MKAKRKRKPRKIDRLEVWVSMSDGTQLCVLSVSLERLTVLGQLYGDLSHKDAAKK